MGLERRKNLNGIDGWLVIFQILFIVPIGSLLINSVYSIFEIREFSFGVIMGYIQLILMLLCAIQFYRRQISFRWFYFATEVIVLWNFIYFRLVQSPILEEWAGMAFIAAIAIVIFIALFKSHRVKNTFS